MQQKVLFQKKSNVGIIILNDSSTLNSMDEEMCSYFESVVAQIMKDYNDLSVVVIKGAGANFSSGGNLMMLRRKASLSCMEAELSMLSFYKGFLKHLNIPLPLVALIEGCCIGAAVGVALACDLRIVVKGAKISVPFLKLGLFPGMGTSGLVPYFFGEQLATYYFLTGKPFSQTDLRMANFWMAEVENAREALEQIEDMSQTFAGLSKPALAQFLNSMRAQKRKILEDCLWIEAKSQALNFKTESFVRRITNLLSKGA